MSEFKFHKRVFEKTIEVNPCAVEHWISTDLFKFRIYAERNKLHVIGHGSKNQIPYYSIFCDEMVVHPANPRWYEGVTVNGVKSRQKKITNIENKDGLRKAFSEEITDQEVIERFQNFEIFILKEALDKFESLTLPSNIMVAEFKKESKLRKIFQDIDVEVYGLDYEFQKDLLSKIGNDYYMSIQLLASYHLNWQYLCGAGSSNLLGVVPVKTLILHDPTINQSFINIVKGIKDVPYCWQGNNREPIPKTLIKDNLLEEFEKHTDQKLNIDFKILQSPTSIPPAVVLKKAKLYA